MHCLNKIAIVLLLSVFLFSFVLSVSASTTGCEMILSGAGNSKLITTASGYTFAFRLNGWDTQGTKAYITIDGVQYTWSEGSTYTIGDVNFYVQSVDVNYTGTQEALGTVKIVPDQGCTVSGCSVALSGPGGTRAISTTDGNTFVVKLNGWDTQGTKAYVAVNDVSYTWSEGSKYTVNGVVFYVQSVDVNYTGAQEAIGSVKMLLNRECTQKTITCTDSDNGINYNVKGVAANSNGDSLVDYCTSDYPAWNLVEGYCGSNGEVLNIGYLCPNGCRDGACLQQPAGSCGILLSGAGDTQVATTADGNTFFIKLNGWDTQGTKIYVALNGISYTWAEGNTYQIGDVNFYVQSVDVSYTGTQEAIGAARITLNRECTMPKCSVSLSGPGDTRTVKTSDGNTFILKLNGWDTQGTKVYVSVNDITYTWAEGSIYALGNVKFYVNSVDVNYTGAQDAIGAARIMLNRECSQQIASCTDSDGGKNYYVKGNLVAGPNNRWDRCYEDAAHIGYLEENYCGSDGSMIVESYKCPNGCSNGACVQISTDYCTDSDGGKNYYSKGEAYGREGNQSFETYDICMSQPYASSDYVDSSGPYLYERYCEGNKVKSEFYTCPNGCRDGACVQNPNVCGNGICETGEANYCETPVCPPGTACPAIAGPCHQGTCPQDCESKPVCGNGVCELGESQQTCPQDCAKTCPASIVLAFNKDMYYPGDYFEVAVKIYDQQNNLMPNYAFNVYNYKDHSTSTFNTDSTGVYRSVSTVPSDPKYSGEWTFVASVSQEGCQYVSDKQTIYINITNKCGDGYCDYNEKEVVCDTVCPQTVCATGEKCEMPACQSVCHAKCPNDCMPNCGNGICDTTGPIPENENNCPQDCKQVKYCGSQSSDPDCVCQDGYTKESFTAACGAGIATTNAAKRVPAASASGGGGSASTGYATASSSSGEAACTDSDGGQNYYVKGAVSGLLPNGEAVKRTDECSGNNPGYSLLEYSCQSPAEFSGAITSETYNCPNGCRDGACNECASDADCPELSCPSGGFVHETCMEGKCALKSDCPNTVKEQVKCVFQNSNSAQKCYSDNGFGCSGTDTCVADVYGASGEKVAWKSTCGGYAHTVTDGQNEYAYFDCGASSTCTYYRCVPAYRNFYLYTDKYAYNIGEQVQISTNSFMDNPLNLTGLQVSVKDPYGQTQTITLQQLCKAAVCPQCIAGEYCPPCKSSTSCSFHGTFTGTQSVGLYGVSSLYPGTDLSISPTQFRVYDNSLLKKYLILEDIDGFKYVDSSVQPSGPENIMGYAANYEKSGRRYMALAADFGNVDTLRKYLNEAFRSNPPNEEKIDGNYVYVLSNGGQKVYAWTYNTFLVGVLKQQTYVTSEATGTVIAPQASATAQTKDEAKKSQDFVTGMVTGTPVAKAQETQTAPANCGTDSLYSQCACKTDETKESFMPPCASGSACTQVLHYRCAQQEPTELLNAYLDMYPSDIKATGTECEQKGGYCISYGDSCKNGFAETSFACKTSSEKCCVKSVDKSDFLDIVMKLESIRVRMDKLERDANALADYYKSTGDTSRANKFSDVAGMFNDGKGMIDDIIAKIRASLDNTDSIRDEVKKDISNLQNHINSILKRMVS